MPRQSGSAAVPVFDGLTADELAALSAHARIQTFSKGATIVNEGDRSDSIFIIASARVKVFLHDEDGKEVVLNILGPGEYFGERVHDERPVRWSPVTRHSSPLIRRARAGM